MQGLLWRGIGLELEVALTIAAHGFCIGLIGAALRLGVIGHVEGQRCLAGLHGLIAEVLESPLPGVDEISSFAPACDIALMRHEVQPGRLFAN
jgi:urease accessory protein